MSQSWCGHRHTGCRIPPASIVITFEMPAAEADPVWKEAAQACARLAFNLLGSVADATSAAEEALLLALHQPESEVPFRLFLQRAVVRAALRRRRVPERALDTMLPPFDIRGDLIWPPADSSANAADLSLGTGPPAGLRRALARLPGIDCAALVLRETEQLPLDEVAWILEIDPEDVRRRIHRALLALTCAVVAWQQHAGPS